MSAAATGMSSLRSFLVDKTINSRPFGLQRRCPPRLMVFSLSDPLGQRHRGQVCSSRYDLESGTCVECLCEWAWNFTYQVKYCHF